MVIEAGASATTEHIVEESHLAVAVGSGDVEVLSTPQLVAWCEHTTVVAIADHLEPGQTTVGMRIRIDHVGPSVVGRTIRVVTRLSLVEGRRLTFEVTAYDGGREVLLGQVIRVIVDREKFMERLRETENP